MNIGVYRAENYPRRVYGRVEWMTSPGPWIHVMVVGPRFTPLMRKSRLTLSYLVYTPPYLQDRTETSPG